MDKFDRHIVKTIELVLKNESGEEDVFVLEPLPFQFMGDLFELIRKMDKAGFDKKSEDMSEEEMSKKMLSVMDKETIGLVQLLVMETLKQSYPDQDVKKLEKFAAAHMWDILLVVIESNSARGDMETIKKAKLMKKIKDDSRQSKPP